MQGALLQGPALNRPVPLGRRYSQLTDPAGGLPRPLSSSCSGLQRVQRRQQTTCAADGPGSGKSKGFRNPFGGGGKQEDDARKQLQNLFKDKPDTLAFYDAPPGGNGGNGKGGGGGGGGDWRNFDWRDWGRKLWGRVKESLQSFAAVLGAICLFAGVLLLAACGPPALSFAVGLLRRVMRLGGSGRARPQLKPQAHSHAGDEGNDESELGPYERQMIAKYGAASVAPREVAAAAAT